MLSFGLVMVVAVNPLVESITAIAAGSIVSSLSRYVFNKPSCVQDCQNVEHEDGETDSERMLSTLNSWLDLSRDDLFR